MLRFRIEAVITALLACLAAITFVWPDWIEFVFGADPDGGSGEVEWGVVLLLATGALIVGLVARYEYRQVTIGVTSKRTING